MKRLIIAAIAAAFATATLSAMAAEDKPYTAQPSIEKPGRAADDTVKSGGSADKPGRAAESDTATTTAKPKHKKKKKTTEEPAAPAK